MVCEKFGLKKKKKNVWKNVYKKCKVLEKNYGFAVNTKKNRLRHWAL